MNSIIKKPKEDFVYFTNMANYERRKIENISQSYQNSIEHFVLQIRSTANFALKGEISPNNARDEIEDLVDLIIKSEKEGLKNALG